MGIKTLRAIAAQWRAANPERNGGVVLIWRGAVYGWKNHLRDPQDEQPGAYAVDATGGVYIAAGGDEYNGAQRWAAVPWHIRSARHED